MSILGGPIKSSKKLKITKKKKPPTRKRTPFSKTEYLWPDGRYRNQRPPLQSKGLASNKKVMEKKVNKMEKKPVKVEKTVNKVEKKVNKVEKKPVKVEKTVNKVEKKVEKPKYKQVSQKELDAKVKERSKPKESKPKKKMHAIEKRNRERFGDAHVDKLKARHAEFKANRKKKKDNFKVKVGG